MYNMRTAYALIVGHDLLGEKLMIVRFGFQKIIFLFLLTSKMLAKCIFFLTCSFVFWD